MAPLAAEPPQVKAAGTEEMDVTEAVAPLAEAVAPLAETAAPLAAVEAVPQDRRAGRSWR